MDAERKIKEKFESQDNFLLTLRFGNGLDLSDVNETIVLIESIKKDSLFVTKELARIFVEIPRVMEGSVALYEEDVQQQIFIAIDRLYSAIMNSLSLEASTR